MRLSGAPAAPGPGERLAALLVHVAPLGPGALAGHLGPVWVGGGHRSASAGSAGASAESTTESTANAASRGGGAAISSGAMRWA